MSEQSLKTAIEEQIQGKAPEDVFELSGLVASLDRGAGGAEAYRGRERVREPC